jgi:hypothetical protein
MCKLLFDKIQKLEQGWNKVSSLLLNDRHCQIIAPNNHVSLHGQVTGELLNMAILKQKGPKSIGEIIHDIMEDSIRKGGTWSSSPMSSDKLLAIDGGPR